MQSEFVIEDSRSRSAPPADDIRAELERILSSPDLHASDRRRAFLRYVVEETLSGRADRLKGYTVATAVFGRDETFDSQTDPVVRLEARRLRRDLDGYYVDAGQHDPVRISIPKGSYIPHFEWIEAVPQPPVEEPATSLVKSAEPEVAGPGAARLRHVLTVVAIVAVLIVAGLAGWLLRGDGEAPAPGDADVGEPAVVVLPFEALGATQDGRYLADGISQELIGDLMKFPGFRLYTLPIGFSDGSSPKPVALGRDLGVAYVVRGMVRDDTDHVRVSAQLFDAATGQVLWTADFDRPSSPESLIRTQTELAGTIAAELGQPYGVVTKDLEVRQAPLGVSNMTSYVCVLRAYGYRRGFSRDEFDPVLGCLEEAVRRDPGYSDAWAMLGWMYMDAGRFGFAKTGDLQAQYQQGLVAAERAVKLDPDNPLALKALSSINYYMGHFDEAERLARKAVELNPNDPDALAQLGWRLAARGKFDEGISVLRHAIERTVNPPGWYFHFVAIDLYLKGDYGEMLKVAERSASDGSAVSQALIAIASAELGDREATRAALDNLPKSGPLARDPAEYFARHGATDRIVNALVTGLEKARAFASET
ncbi:MAG: tetratricopeptide repeat protein [Bauldia sp.]|uniref:tetratricopeptide repeat protein n=1 Tax=Bauldia sp. TaxID=2575872 RepID=UPI001D465A5C|nr:tetratricopeptide repeat protein [Bauldia sp.]MCB1495247.1 tetratricopeptide repeat protein [Bauldia sp.]